MIHTVKGFGVVSKAEIDVSLELSCFFNDPADARTRRGGGGDSEVSGNGERGTGNGERGTGNGALIIL